MRKQEKKQEQNVVLSFHNDPNVKAKYLGRVKAHEVADEIVQGQYWEGGKGCAVGCTVEKDGGEDPHLAYALELGVPEWVAHFEDRMFEMLSNGEAKVFPRRFLEVIPVGVPESEFERVRYEFLIFLLQETLQHEGLWRKHDVKDSYVSKVVSAVRGQILLLQKALLGERDEAAWSAARSAASAAESAARSKMAEKFLSLLTTMKPLKKKVRS